MLKIAGRGDTLERHRHGYQTFPEDGATDYAPIMESYIREPLRKMALQLKSHVVLALSPRPIAMFGVTYPVFFESSHEDLIREVVREQAQFDPSLTYVQINAAQASAVANQVGWCQCELNTLDCWTQHFPADDMILFIDHSDVFLTMYTYGLGGPKGKQGRTVIDIRRTVPVQDNAEGTTTAFWNKVARTLRLLASKTGNRINNIILSGTRADDPNLHGAIQFEIGDIDQQRYSSYIFANPESSDYEQRYILCKLAIEAVVDPVLAAAQGVADLGWRQSLKVCLDPCEQWKKLPLALRECMDDSRHRQALTATASPTDFDWS